MNDPSPSSQPVPPPSGPAASPNRTGRNIALIVIIVLVLICCLCLFVAGVGATAYLLISPARHSTTQQPFPIPEQMITEEVVPVPENQPTEITPTQPESIPTQASKPLSEDTPEPPSSTAGLGVSRAEMMEFFSEDGAFTFDSPMEVQGVEMVQGTHEWLCVQDDCASVTLAGPKEDLLVVSVVAPIDPDDSTQSITAITLLMTAAARFSDEKGSVPTLLMADLLQARGAGDDLHKTFENNGYLFTEFYDTSSRMIGLTVSRPK